MDAPDSGLSEEFGRLNFELNYYCSSNGKKCPCYALTQDGFTLLVMGYTGKKAMQFKEAYIKRFNEMSDFIKTLQHARNQFPKLTAQITMLHEDPKPYHYSNECNMLNRIVLGKTAKQVREEHGLSKGESIRPYLTDEQIKHLEYLQDFDLGLLYAVSDYDERRRKLEYIYHTQCLKDWR